MAEKKPPTPAEIVIMSGGGLMAIGSFLPFYKAGPFDWSVWSNTLSLFPLMTLMVLLGLAMGIRVAVTRFADVSLPERVWRFTWTELQIVLSILIALTTLAYVARSLSGLSKGIGAWLILIAAIGLVAGAVMMQQERTPTAS